MDEIGHQVVVDSAADAAGVVDPAGGVEGVGEEDLP